jgi:hypothetical protein
MALAVSIGTGSVLAAASALNTLFPLGSAWRSSPSLSTRITGAHFKDPVPRLYPAPYNGLDYT